MARHQSGRALPQDSGWRTDPSRALEARRREIAQLLEDIRSDQPSPTRVVDAIKQASRGEISADHLRRITAGVLSLYR